MTRTLTVTRCAFGLALLCLGCNSGPLGPNSGYSTVPPSRMGSPPSQAPIASQPTISPTGTNSSVQVVPFAALPPHAIRSAQNGMRPLVMLAANDANIDGRSFPYLQRAATVPKHGGAKSVRARSAAATPNFNALAGGVAQSPQEDLRYRGGRTIKDLKYINIYVGGQNAWDPNDWKSIDKALAAAMSDEHLNNVVVQYFGNQPVSSTFLKSFFLSGWHPTNVPKSDLERQVSGLYSNGAFNGLDLPNTLINFMLPRGTVLGDPSAGAQQTAAAKNTAIPKDDAEDSTGGLGGYHGSVHVNGATVYYAVGVYSERLPNGTSNGIPVFDQNWKNVVATFYHELQEARTDPDVGDAADGVGPNPGALLGWTSDTGNEIGDYPIAEATQLQQVFQEVPLTDGSGTVPVQFNYSNAVHGPEGPIPYPHGMNQPLPNTKPPTSNPQPIGGGGTVGGNSPVITDPDLAKLAASWNQLEDFVRKAIVRLANSR